MDILLKKFREESSDDQDLEKERKSFLGLLKGLLCNLLELIWANSAKSNLQFICQSYQQYILIKTATGTLGRGGIFGHEPVSQSCAVVKLEKF